MSTTNTTGNDLMEAAVGYAERGWSIIPVKFENGRKQGAIRWKRYQDQRPDSKRLKKWFSNGKYPALAVVLGPISGDLACRDFDDPTAYETWAKKFPELAKVLPTVKTGRGYHIYFVARVEKTIHYIDGELRGAKSLCCLPPSPHPNGSCYKWLNRLPDEDLPAIDPENSGLCGKPMVQKRTDENGSSRKQTDLNGSKLSAEGVKDEIELAIQATLPLGPGQRNRRVFQFARAIKGISAFARADVKSLRSYVERWHSRALPYINTKEFEETWIDFLWAWPRITRPMRLNLMEDAMKSARANPVNGVPYEQSGLCDLVSLCRELHRIMDPEPFWLSVRTAARLLAVGATTAWRWLFLLVEDEWIRIVEKGGTKEKPYKATRFRYIGDDKKEE